MSYLAFIWSHNSRLKKKKKAFGPLYRFNPRFHGAEAGVDLRRLSLLWTGCHRLALSSCLAWKRGGGVGGDGEEEEEEEGVTRELHL